jgi:DNA-binding response OmpR family regulator
VARILIVDPHPDICALLELVVRRLRHEPVTYGAATIDQAVVDAAVVEPAGSGLAIARRLRDAGVPLLFASIFAPTLELMELEPFAYLVKPFRLHELESALARLLETTVAKAAGQGLEP